MFNHAGNHGSDFMDYTFGSNVFPLKVNFVEMRLIGRERGTRIVLIALNIE